MFILGLREELRHRVMESGKSNPLEVFRYAQEMEQIEEEQRQKKPVSMVSVITEVTNDLKAKDGIDLEALNNEELLPFPHASKTPDLFALSNSERPQCNIVSHYSINDYHKVNYIYVCPGNSVLRNNVKSHCLGALYKEDIKGAKALCDLDIIPEREQELQLSDNYFLVNFIHHPDVSLSCPNIPNKILKLHDGISVYKIPNTCALKLENTPSRF